MAIPVSNASINPARSTAVAFFNGDGAPGQLWAFWVAPVVGALIAGATFAFITGEDRSEMDIDGSTDDVANAEVDAAGPTGARRLTVTQARRSHLMFISDLH